jgi:tRNA-dihydrouridine synthase A
MRRAVDVPVTVKTRIGIDDRDSYRFLCDFVESVAEAGCSTFVVHARIALLEGLSPRENRSVPPLDYERVYRLKDEHPDLTIVLNGGISTTAAILEHLQHVDGIMIGREAYQNPWFLVEVERALGATGGLARDRHEVLERMLPYIEAELARGTELKHMTRHLLGLFAGQPGARAWRRHLSENAHRAGAGIGVLQAAMDRQQLAA